MSLLNKFRQKPLSVEDLQKKVSGSRKEVDERFWSLKGDVETGSASAVFRFLPANENGDTFVSYSNHFFKGEKGYFVEKCPKSLDRDADCPACDSFWSSFHENGKRTEDMPKHIKERGPTKHFVSNIVVLKDPANPQNEGKVFLFDYKAFFMNEIKDAINPKVDGEVAFNPFDLMNGADFNFKIFKDGRFPSYKKSFFSEPAPLYDGDVDKIEAVLEQLIPIDEFTFEKEIKAKSTEDLYEAYNKATGEGMLLEAMAAPEAHIQEIDDSIDETAGLAALNEDEGTDVLSTDSEDDDDFNFDEFDELFDEDAK